MTHTEYWVRSAGPLNVPAQTGMRSNFGYFQFNALPFGWKLIGIGTSMTPSAFNNGIGQAVPPSPGAMQANFESLWAWDATTQAWMFYSPGLEASGGLASVKAYAQSKGYEHFQDVGRTLEVGGGFWVHKQ